MSVYPVSNCDRRRFLLASGGAVGAALAAGMPTLAQETAGAAPANRGRIFKSVKWGMVPGRTKPVLDKFKMCQDLGYDGMELITPSDLKADEVREASEKTGMPVHGVVGQKHWKIRLSSAKPAERNEGREDLVKALHDTKAFGGDSVLLVPGKVTGDNETHDDVWKRSIVEIRKVLPTASKLGVRVLIENVWNGFCETPEQLRDYIDEIASPWVGVYFDIGNVRKFSPSEEWVRVLGNRIVKLDVKDWSKAEGFKAEIGDGDVNWPAVCEELAKINFTGWCTAEVRGGNADRLRDIAERMDKSLLL